jgi:hypothetical protein
MQYNFKNTHINYRFKERFGREFTAKDRRNLINLVSEGKAKIFVDRKDKEKYCIICKYEGINSIFILSKNMDFITYMRGK